uniref:Exocyst complex component Sec10 n=1 Tax=Hydatigena taeniaeformis TaxID=6205 RepID=A0A0R3WVZ4_HYDTA
LEELLASALEKVEAEIEENERKADEKEYEDFVMQVETSVCTDLIHQFYNVNRYYSPGAWLTATEC